MPMPPYSGGRCGAHRPSDLTRSCTLSRSSLASARSASVTLDRRPLQSAASLGRISSLTMRAVRIRMSLMWSLNPAIGVTLIGMALSSVSSALVARTLRRFGRLVLPGGPTADQGALVAAPAHEADRPPGQGAEPVLEPGQKGHVDDQPEQPAPQAADAQRTH